MAIFLDTGFYLGLIHKNDENFDVAQEWLKKIQLGVYGQIYTSNYVIAETATLVAVRTRGSILALEKTRNLLKGDLQIATILYVSEDEETSCWDLFSKLATANELFTKDGIISYVECTNITLCTTHSIEYIASFDGHYKGWLNYP